MRRNLEGDTPNNYAIVWPRGSFRCFIYLYAPRKLILPLIAQRGSGGT